LIKSCPKALPRRLAHPRARADNAPRHAPHAAAAALALDQELVDLGVELVEELDADLSPRISTRRAVACTRGSR